MIVADMNMGAELLVAKQKIDQQSALLAQMAAALEEVITVKHTGSPEFAAVKKALADAEAALTAYTTMSPDPQWQDKAKRARKTLGDAP